MLLPGSVLIERHWGIVLPSYGIETIVTCACFVGLGPALYVFFHQSPPEPDDLDDPDW